MTGRANALPTVPLCAPPDTRTIFVIGGTMDTRAESLMPVSVRATTYVCPRVLPALNTPVLDTVPSAEFFTDHRSAKSVTAAPFLSFAVVLNTTCRR